MRAGRAAKRAVAVALLTFGMSALASQAVLANENGYEWESHPAVINGYEWEVAPSSGTGYEWESHPAVTEGYEWEARPSSTDGYEWETIGASALASYNFTQG